VTLPELLMPVDHVLSVNCRHVVSELKRQASVQHPAYMLVELVLRKPPSCAVGGVRRRRKGTGGATLTRPLCSQQCPCGSPRRLPHPRSPANGQSSLWRLALMTHPLHRTPQCSPRRRFLTSHCLAEKFLFSFWHTDCTEQGIQRQKKCVHVSSTPLYTKADCSP